MQYPLDRQLEYCYSNVMDVQGFSLRLKTARVRKGLNKSELSRLIGKSPAYVNLWESGTRGRDALPAADVLDRLAEELGVSEDWLKGKVVTLLDDGEPVPVPNAEGDYEYREVRRFVESNPDPNFRARLARQEARRTPESYQRLIFRIFKAWLSNADLGLGEAEEEDDLRPGTDR